MPRLKKKITIRTISALTPDPTEDTWLWDEELTRFAFRMKPSGSGSYVIVYRTRQRKQRQMLVGRLGVVTPEQARANAKGMLAEVDAGRDPADTREQDREAITIEELCTRYLQAARAGLVKTRFGKPKKASTIAIDEGRVTRHIVPLIGQKLARDLRRADVQVMADAITEGKTAVEIKTKARGVARVTGGAGTAARVVELFGGIWSWAEKRDIVTGPSPVKGVERSKGDTKDRVLSGEELALLGYILREQSPARPLAVAALRLIALTGLRREEACALRWDEVSFAESCLRLKDTKTGRSTRPIGKRALDLISSLPRINQFVFPGRSEGKSADLKKQLAALFDAAGLGDARSHDLRRTFASTAAEMDYSDATIGETLGHAKRGVTSKHYIRRPDAALVEAVTRVSDRIAAALDGETLATIALFNARKGA
jgi:integrase